MTAPGEVAAQASLVSPLGSNQSVLSGCDDCYESVSLTEVFPDGINLGGTIYQELFIGSNGYVTLGHGNMSFSPLGIAGYSDGPIVAPQFDDLDPSKGGEIYYAQNASGGYLVVTWDNVMPYSSPIHGSGTNSFQVVLRRIDGGASQDFQIELRYHRLDWAQSGNNSAPPTGGWSAGDQATYAEVPLSGQPNFRDLEGMSNVSETGVFRWQVEGGIVESTPTVNETAAVTSITGTSAASGGNISSDGGHPVTERGLVWSTSTGPTLADASVQEGSGTGGFTATMTGLSPGTTYHVRAYATNALGTAYGPSRQFATSNVTVPSVTTDQVTSVDTVSASVSGMVTSDGGATVTERGVAYGTSSGPTTSGPTVTSGDGTGAFTAVLKNLDPATSYYVRAYAVNSEGTSYGTQLVFTTDKLSQVIQFDPLESRTYGDGPLNLSPSASSGLQVELASDDPAIASVAGGTLTIHAPGKVTITATQAGNQLYHAADPVLQTLQVEPRPVMGHFSVEPEKIYDESTLVVITEMALSGVLKADEGQVLLSADSAHLQDPMVGNNKTVTLAGARLEGALAHRYTLAGIEPATADVLPGPPHYLTLTGPPSVVAGSPSSILTLRVRDQYGNATPAPEVMTFALSMDSSGAGAEFLRLDREVMDDHRLTIPEGASAASFRYRPGPVGTGVDEITVRHLEGSELPGGVQANHEMRVVAARWSELRLQLLAGGEPMSKVEIGEPFTVRVVALDSLGNRAPAAEALVSLQSQGPLSLTGGVQAELIDGMAIFEGVRFTDAGEYTVRIEVQGQDELSLSVESDPVQVLHPFPDVSVGVQADRSRAGPGDIVEFTVRVENRGEGPAHDIRLPSPLGESGRLEVVEVIPSIGSWSPSQEVWTIDALEAGEAAVLVIRARIGGR